MKDIAELVDRMQGRRVYFDTNAIIYFIEQNPQFHAVVLEIFKLIGSDSISALTSQFTLTEMLIKPIRDKQPALIQNIKDLLLDREFFIQPAQPRDRPARCARFVRKPAARKQLPHGDGGRPAAAVDRALGPILLGAGHARGTVRRHRPGARGRPRAHQVLLPRLRSTSARPASQCSRTVCRENS